MLLEVWRESMESLKGGGGDNLGHLGVVIFSCLGGLQNWEFPTSIVTPGQKSSSNLARVGEYPSLPLVNSSRIHKRA